MRHFRNIDNTEIPQCEIPKNRGTQIVGNGIFRDPKGYEKSNGCSPGVWSKDSLESGRGGQ